VVREQEPKMEEVKASNALGGSGEGDHVGSLVDISA
jgi:hypothetical protein